MKKKEIDIKARINKLIDTLSKDLIERRDIIAVSLLGCLIQESIFLYGPPGTGKSFIAKRLSRTFQEQKYFEYLMQKFSTPEEIFGQISITELKKDNYKRLTEGYLPTANFAFLDEIWKSSPAILNTLLTILNEKIFKNGKETTKVPLKVFISASNETPPKNQGLEALYDRFLLRINTPPIVERESFNNLLNSKKIFPNINIEEEFIIKNEELDNWKKEIENIKLSNETLDIFYILRTKIFEKSKKLDVYVSDRRWKKISFLLKASAFFCNRTETNLSDILLLKYCLWSTEENREGINKLIEDTIKENAYTFPESLVKFDEKKDALDKEINNELYYTEDLYDTENINGKEYFKVIKESKESRDRKYIFYIGIDLIKSKKEFNPIDENGNSLGYIKCNFDGNKSCKIEIKDYYSSFREYPSYTPKILFHKGDKKKNVNERLINSLKENVEELIKECNNMLDEVNVYLEILNTELDNPFIQEKDKKIPLIGINNLLSDMELRKKDCERMEGLVK